VGSDLEVLVVTVAVTGMTPSSSTFMSVPHCVTSFPTPRRLPKKESAGAAPPMAARVLPKVRVSFKKRIVAVVRVSYLEASID
jgi:hypothetical protein